MNYHLRPLPNEGTAMNDPSDTHSQIEDALAKLEEEYMCLAEVGDQKAIRYAWEESEEFAHEMYLNAMALLRGCPEARENPVFAQVHIQRLAQDLINALDKHVAPVWAHAEYTKRREEARELQEDYHASEWPDARTL